MPHLPQEGDAVHARHVDVGEAERQLAVGLEQRERHLAVLRLEACETLRFQHADQRRAHLRVVVHHDAVRGRTSGGIRLHEAIQHCEFSRGNGRLPQGGAPLTLSLNLPPSASRPR